MMPPAGGTILECESRRWAFGNRSKPHVVSLIHLWWWRAASWSTLCPLSVGNNKITNLKCVWCFVDHESGITPFKLDCFLCYSGLHFKTVKPLDDVFVTHSLLFLCGGWWR